MTILRTAATIAILGGLAWMIEFDAFLNSILQAQMSWLIVAALLLPVNIALETWKWKALLKTTSEPTTTDALGSILAGYALGLFSPGRAGDYVGRILYLKDDGFQTAVQTGLDRVISMSVYLGAGLIALCLAFWMGIVDFSGSWSYIAPIGVVLALTLIVLVVRPTLLYRALSWFSRSRKWTRSIRFMGNVDRRLSVHLLALSALRYVVFTSQLVALILAFGGESSGALLYLCASLVFFIKTMIPSFTFADLGIRETASVFFFGLVGIVPAAALNASLMLFALNLVIPAIAGAVFVPRLRVPVRFRKSAETRVGSVA